MVPRAAAILTRSPGRHAGTLHDANRVVGVDVDPTLIAIAGEEASGPTYLVGDLAGFELPADVPQQFDAILCAGNVMGFLHPDTRVPVLEGFARRLAPSGRAVAGFCAGRGYDFADFFADAAAAGLVVQSTFSTWDLRPFSDASDFVVAFRARLGDQPAGSVRLCLRQVL